MEMCRSHSSKPYRFVDARFVNVMLALESFKGKKEGFVLGIWLRKGYWNLKFRI